MQAFYLPLPAFTNLPCLIMFKQTAFLLCLLCFSTANAQKKSLEPLKTDADIIVDGFLNDSIWQHAPEALDFVMLSPGNGDEIPKQFETKVKVFYTDEAICFGLIMKDPAPDSILKQITQRDDVNQNHDWLAIAINPFNDGQNDFSFFVTAAGTQGDSRTTANGDDYSINSIWYSAVQITDEGWVCEVKIPYISLRFPSQMQKDWGFNVIRSIRRSRKEYSWNYIDRGSGYSWEYQAGVLKNIRDINPPIRLSLMPYASSYVDNFMGETNLDFNAGMDLKYGINESFTLDATLIPDFGQVAFDDQFLNLSAFEIQFDENRQFFNEGTELFSLGNLFYSRRIGGAPRNITNQDLSGNDTNITVRTEFTRLLNATKISGRTNGNLGIGVLNAVTDNNYSIIDSAGTQKKALLEPLTNYNIFVLDQRFNRNSSVSFINTNTLRNGEFTDANVAGLLASIFTKSGQYRVDLELKRSDQFNEGRANTSGEQYYFRFGDVDGNWRWATQQTVITEDYNPNDLGFQARNNWIRNYSELEYATFKPSGLFNRTSFTIFSVYSMLYENQKFEEFYLGLNSFFLLRDFTGTGLRLRFRPIPANDYFEPRVADASFRKPLNYSTTYFLSTDYRKPLALDLDLVYSSTPEWGRNYYNINIEPRVRLGDHFFIIPQATFDLTYADRGFASIEAGEPVFGERDVKNLTLLIDGRYAINPKATLGLRLRQFWSRVEYDSYYDLRSDGNLSLRDDDLNNDLYFNTLNLDLRFSWWFAPASEMVILYRVALSNVGDNIEDSYLQNLDNAFTSPVQNNLSIRLAYFLDYDRTRRQLKGERN